MTLKTWSTMSTLNANGNDSDILTYLANMIWFDPEEFQSIQI